MVFELTQETVRPGRLPVLLGSLQVAVRWRDGEYGTLAGSWTTEIGTLNRCITLWRYDDAVQRENVADALADAPDWQAYKESIRPELVQQSHPDNVATMSAEKRAAVQAEAKRANAAYAVLRQARGASSD